MKIWLYCGIAALVSFIIGVILYKIFIPYLRKVKLGQKILEIGPSWHKSKEGTPNLGGLFFIIACLIGWIVAFLFFRNDLIAEYANGILESQSISLVLPKMLLLLGFALSQGIIGFVDDYVKLFKKRNKGLSASQKLILQFLTAGIYLFFFGADTAITTPWGDLELGIFYYVAMLLAIVYIINCANLTDGIDGLAGSVALIICVMFMIFANQVSQLSAEIGITSAALIGALLAFLVFNFHPAKIFMGDTGSLFLGGFVVGLVMLTNNEFILLPISCIWIIEGLSVVIQVLSFKLTGKRVFKMSPIHHHFEKCSWSEVKIVAVFSLVTVIFSALSYYLLII
ncbi:MAG: phospho-N-acetylmuramoyl-pentapeptide-transferase [Ruminococcaceae bacterium]|nr:phospho-N-acetylmuramoyl-pentapeptide-transferase [Oscillospiraceae bacterium]